jgi:uncharacterized membrane protein
MPSRLVAAPLRIFATGLLALLPLAATLALLVWSAQLLYHWLGPSSRVGGALKAIGLGITESEIAGYAMGIVIVLLLIFALGVLVETGLQRGLLRVVDALLKRIPLVGRVYHAIQHFVDVVAPRGAGDDRLRSMRPVWCHFGGPGGAAVLALQSTASAVPIGAGRYVGVLVPTAPVPIGGGLIYVPEHWVTPADLGVDALTSIYVSMGVTSAQHLGPVSPATGQGAADAR